MIIAESDAIIRRHRAQHAAERMGEILQRFFGRADQEMSGDPKMWNGSL